MEKTMASLRPFRPANYYLPKPIPAPSTGVRFGLPIQQPSYGLPVQPVRNKPVGNRIVLPIQQPIKFGLPIMGRVTFQPMKRK
jgi:hypothetical protein